MTPKANSLAALPIVDQLPFGRTARSLGFHPADILGPNVDPFTPEGVGRALRARGIASVTPAKIKPL